MRRVAFGGESVVTSRQRPQQDHVLTSAASAARAAALHARARPAMARLARAMAPEAGAAAPAEDELRALADLAARFSAGPIAAMSALGPRLRAALPD